MGVTGILVDEGDEAALAEAMTWMYANQDAARQMGEAGRERVATHFAAPAWNALLEQRLLGLLERRAHGSADCLAMIFRAGSAGSRAGDALTPGANRPEQDQSNFR